MQPHQPATETPSSQSTSSSESLDADDKLIRELEQKQVKLEKAVKVQLLQRNIGLLEAKLSELSSEGSKPDKSNESIPSTLSEDTERHSAYQTAGTPPQSWPPRENSERQEETGDGTDKKTKEVRKDPVDVLFIQKGCLTLLITFS